MSRGHKLCYLRCKSSTGSHKIPYKTFDHADKTALKRGWAVKVYPCPYTNRYHITHTEEQHEQHARGREGSVQRLARGGERVVHREDDGARDRARPRSGSDTIGGNEHQADRIQQGGRR